MTSKISLSKLIVSDLKRRSWLIILIALAGVFIFPVMYSMRLMWVRDETAAMVMSVYGTEAVSLADKYYNVAQAFFSPSGGMIVFIAAVAAVLSAFTGFSWLHSREQTDFYAGMPVKRVHLFLAPYISGILIAVIPYLICSLLALLGVGAAFGNVTGKVLSMAIPGLIWGIVGYLAVYTAAVFAMLITGRPVIGICMMGLLGFYGPLFYILVNYLAEDSFNTWYSRTGIFWSQRFSPLFVMTRVDGHPLDGLLLIIYFAVFLAVCILCMERRPMEKAETPFIHPLIAPLLKVLTAIPAAMFTGLLVSELIGTAGGGRKWEIFWCFAAALGYHVLYELIMSTDVKNLLGHWRSAAAVFAGVLIFVCIFPLDLLGYDRYLPSEDKVKAMAIDSNNLFQCFTEETWYNYSDQMPDGKSKEEFLLKEAMTEQFGPFYELAREGVLNSAQNEENASNVVVCYRLKSGREVFRRYKVRIEAVEKALTAVTSDADYRKKAYPFRYLDDQFLQDVTVTGWTLTGENVTSFKFDDEERKALMMCLQEDCLKVNAGDLIKTAPLAILTCNKWYETKDGFSLRDVMDNILIYPQFSRTVAFFDARGGLPDHEEKPGAYSEISFWDKEDYYILKTAADIDAFFACVARPTAFTRMKSTHVIYFDARPVENKGTPSGSFIVKDQAAFDALLKRVGKSDSSAQTVVG